MSYSFSITASNKCDAAEKVLAKFDEIVLSQPVHKVDKDQAFANATSALGVLADPTDEQEIVGSCSGYVSWQGEDHITTVNISSSFSLKNKE